MLRSDEPLNGNELATFTTSDLLEYLRAAKLATVSTIGPDGSPQSALVGIGVTEIFKSFSTQPRRPENIEI